VVAVEVLALVLDVALVPVSEEHEAAGEAEVFSDAGERPSAAPVSIRQHRLLSPPRHANRQGQAKYFEDALSDIKKRLGELENQK